MARASAASTRKHPSGSEEGKDVEVEVEEEVEEGHDDDDDDTAPAAILPPVPVSLPARDIDSLLQRL